jgi:hypothetical protein
MTPEIYTDGKALLFRTARRPTPPIGTQLPADAPPAYARSQLGANTLAYMRARGWLDGPRVTRLAEHERAAAKETV